MKRVLAVVLIAALTTVALGIDHTVSASQSGDQKRDEKQRAEVTRALAGMQRGRGDVPQGTPGGELRRITRARSS